MTVRLGHEDGWEVSIEVESSGRLQRREKIGSKAGWDVKVYKHDHPPAHIHAWHDGDHVVVWLERPPRYEVKKGKPKANDLRRLMNLVGEKMDDYLRAFEVALYQA